MVRVPATIISKSTEEDEPSQYYKIKRSDSRSQ